MIDPEHDTTIYINDDGYHIPFIFTRYNKKMINAEIGIYSWFIGQEENGVVPTDTEKIKRYEGYIAWLKNRHKKLSMLELLTCEK